MGGSSPEGLIALFGSMVLLGLMLIFTKVSVHGRAPGLGVAFIVLGAVGLAFFLKVFEGALIPWKLGAWGLANCVWFGIPLGVAYARRRARMRSMGL
jgi:hypothetical protein